MESRTQQQPSSSSSSSSPSSSSSSSSNSGPRSFLLPCATLQPTYTDVYADVLSGSVAAENVWLSVYSDNAPERSIHGTVQLRLREKDDVNERDQMSIEVVKAANRIEVQERTASSSSRTDMPDLIVSTVESSNDPSSSTSTSPTSLQNAPSLPPTTLRLPNLTLPAILKGRRSARALEQGGGASIAAFGVSSSAEHFIAGGEDGEVVVGGLPAWLKTQRRPPASHRSQNGSSAVDSADANGDQTMLSVEEKAQRRIKEIERKRAEESRSSLKGHLGDIRSATFFPSGQVVLTTSADLTIRLFSLAGVNPRTFRGHKRSVTATQILGRGKRFLSASLDGTLKLWDVATERSLRTIAVRRMSGAESLACLRLSSLDDECPEEGLGQYLVVVGLSNGWIDVISLNLSLLTPSSKQIDPETGEEKTTPAKIRVQDFSVAQIPPTEYPSVASRPEDRKEGAGAADFWSVEATGSVWAVDVSLRQQGSSLALAAGTKNGIVRIFHLSLVRLLEIAREKEASEEAGTTLSLGGSSAEKGATAGETSTEASAEVGFEELVNVKRNGAGINNLLFLPRPHPVSSSSSKKKSGGAIPDVIVAPTDGLPYRLTLDQPSSDVGSANAVVVPRVKEEYTGWEAGDGVEGIAFVEQTSSSGGRDGTGDEEAMENQEKVRVVLAGAEGCIRAY